MPKLKVLLFASLLSSSFSALSQQVNGIQRLNNTVIFDLFINFEITEKNGNSSVLIDYLPHVPSSVEKITMTSNYGGERETSTFDYSADGKLARLTYEKTDKFYQYDFNYENGVLKSVNIAGKKKIDFTYRNDTLVTITREKNGAQLEYNLTYLNGERRADLRPTMVRDGKRMTSSSTYYATWNENDQITSYNMDIYVSKDLTYTASGDRLTFTFIANDNWKTATWQYILDDKKNWTERTFDRLSVKRAITYR